MSLKRSRLLLDRLHTFSEKVRPRERTRSLTASQMHASQMIEKARDVFTQQAGCAHACVRACVRVCVRESVRAS
eukprot:272213-Pleurochrysis_carterae.AAC.1